MHEQHSASPDAVVIGGGVIGLAVAWRAAQRGLRVTVLERDRPGSGTSRVAAGMIAPISEARSTEQPLLRLGLASAHAYPGFISALEDHDAQALLSGAPSDREADRPTPDDGDIE